MEPGNTPGDALPYLDDRRSMYSLPPEHKGYMN